MITNNNFFAYFIKVIDILRYKDDQRILPTNNVVDIYRYSDAMLKHMPRKAPKNFKIHYCKAKKPRYSQMTTTED